ncbi:SNF2 family N-terminal domain-containing protein [Vararia minispora EC-137]|uniref:SNF2 family N-terminal domain-containing protein n=1 Tax=Vararia minispora EC-137 TaxID=1314806 RepID=A0ACB8QTJ9_9AGAM|nr:SNF2 family N-terminal domain-containing protein [Vararia minispora EC-137]
MQNRPSPNQPAPTPVRRRRLRRPPNAVVKNASVLNAAIEDPDPQDGKQKDLDFAQLPDAEDNYDDEGNWMGRARDNFVGPRANENDINEFIVNASNAEVFDGNETVGKALEELALDSLDTIPPGMTITLMAHQVIGVSWMIKQEDSHYHGGCLGDEMGLGKVIATIVMNPAEEDEPRTKTLIIAPLGLLEQWKDEIETKTNVGIKCLIYHGSEKTKILKPKEFAKYEIVLTTYATMALEWPDPEEERRREKKDKKKRKKGKKSADDDFIVEDDGPGANAYRREGRKSAFQWYRIVCDEAHNIRNHRTRASRAIADLKSKYRWALTGTPIINSLDDAYPIIRFIRLRPWYDRTYWWDRLGRLERKEPKRATRRLQAIYKTFQYRRKKDSMLNGKLLIELPPRDVKIIKLEFTEQEREIYKMIETQSQAIFNDFLRAGTVLKNYREVLVLLLRLRQICSHPSLIQEDPNSAMSFGGADAARPQAYKDELTRARDVVGPNFVDRLKQRRVDIARERMKIEKESPDAEIDGEECPICMDTLTDAIVTQCEHVFCRGCIGVLPDLIVLWMTPSNVWASRGCPSCRGHITDDKIFSLAAFEPTDAEMDAPEATLKGGGDDSDIEMLNDFGSDDEDDLPPRRTARKKSKGKGRAIYVDSEDDSEHADMEDDLSDFIVGDDEDDEDVDARRALKRKAKANKPSGTRKRPIVLDSDDEFEPEEAEVVFGKKKDEPELTPEQIKLMPKFLQSTKMQHMMDTILDWTANHPDEKIIVVSQWTSCIDLMSNFLKEKDIMHIHYRGSMSMRKRDVAVRLFQSKEKPRLMLMSTKCGGVGLNLTRGNRMICMDLAWSEAVENQAWSRIHRLGQKRSVFVERFVIQDTIEDRILALQERKKLIADSSLGESEGGRLGRLSVKDLAGRECPCPCWATDVVLTPVP